MLKLLVKALGMIAGLALSGAACAVGMGGINVTTALGEPMKAEIELVAVGKADKGNLSARMASPDIFKGAGVEYPAALPKLKFSIETRASGESYIKVTSALPVNEPFVNMLVELTWSSGKLLREYTFLLDPPGFKAEQPKASVVQPVPSIVSEPIEPAPATVGAEQGGAMTSEPAPMHAAAPMEESTSVMKAGEGRNVAAGVIKVKRGDTLSKIAIEVKPADVSLERMLVALYRANADTFDGNNMNRLKTGKILRVPEAADLDEVQQKEAVKEIHTQAADWHAYRQKLAAASSAAAEQAPKQEVSGKISTTVADKTPAAKETAKEVVKLSKGEAPGDKAVAAANAKSAQDKMRALEEEAIARSKALTESNERVALLEKNIKEMQHLIELKGKAAEPAKPEVKPETKPEPAKVETKPAAPAAPVAAVKVPAAPVVVATSGVSPAPAKPIVARKVSPPPPSMLDEILDEPLYLAGGAAVLLGLGAFGYMRAQRGKGSKPGKKAYVSSREDEAGSRISAPILPSPDTGDFTQSAAVAPISPMETEDVDPISEADLFLNFGRDVQAEEILKDALERNPANQQVRLKLLSIYANRKDTKSFSSVAREVQNSGDAAAWAQAAEMGRKMEPNNPMYGGQGNVVEISEAPAAEAEIAQTASGLDFDLGLSEPADAATDNAGTAMLDVTQNTEAAASSGLDFDLGISAEAAPTFEGGDSTVVLQPQNEQVDAMAGLDFDLGIGTPEEATPAAADIDSTMVMAPLGDSGAASASAQVSAMDFDITIAPPESPAQESGQAEALANTDEGMEFTLDFPVSDEPSGEETGTAAQATAKEMDLDLGDLNLDLDALSATPSAAAEIKNSHWHEVATKLDLARAYQEMGDAAGAREILDEVLRDGDDRQRAAAEVMLQQLSV